MTTLDTVTLPPALSWDDEFEPYGAAASVKRRLDGGFVMQSAPLSAGREITLSSGDNFGWATRSVVESLFALAQVPGVVYSLTGLRGANYNVAFNHANSPAFSAEPVMPWASPQDGDYYRITLRLVTV